VISLGFLSEVDFHIETSIWSVKIDKSKRISNCRFLSILDLLPASFGKTVWSRTYGRETVGLQWEAVMGRFESQKWIVKSRILRFESQIQSRTLSFWRIAFYWIGLLFFLQESDSWKRFFLTLFLLPRTNQTIKRKLQIKWITRIIIKWTKIN